MSHSIVAKLLDADTVNETYGSWVDIGAAESASAHVDGIVSGDKVKLWISNHPDTPATANQILFGSELTADGITEITTQAKYIRAQLSAVAGGGTITVYLNYLENA